MTIVLLKVLYIGLKSSFIQKDTFPFHQINHPSGGLKLHISYPKKLSSNTLSLMNAAKHMPV